VLDNVRHSIEQCLTSCRGTNVCSDADDPVPAAESVNCVLHSLGGATVDDDRRP
jgi:hypothetical protein